MNRSGLALPPDGPVPRLARTLAESGGRLLIVGGWVRDALRGKSSKDFDLEVFGLSAEVLSAKLQPLGFTPPVGKQFPIWRHTRDALDLALPRLESDTDGKGKGASLSADGLRTLFREAARHRDLTVNAMGWDPLSQVLIDPWGGEADLHAGRLRAVSRETFGRDPLRLLRVARLAAQLEAEPDSELKGLCASLDLSSVPVERTALELRRLLCEPTRPSRAFEGLADCGRLDIFPLVAGLRGVPQDPRWHPEGDVYVHTLMVLDAARALSESLSNEDREILMLAALAHDFGKPATTEKEGDRIRSHGHEAVSASLAQKWLSELRFSESIVRATKALVAHHLAPAQLPAQGAGARAYRRLARKLDGAGTTMVDLERLARADHLGRTTESARAGVFSAGDDFLAQARAARVDQRIEPDRVEAQHLLKRGMTPGPRFGEILKACRAIQDETGSRDPAEILERALGEIPEPAASPPRSETSSEN